MDVHPYRAAWETRDLDPWIAALAPDVRLRSPILRRPFQGREEARELFEVLFGAFGTVELMHEFGTGDTYSFFWRGELKGRWVEGADLIHHNADGEIYEVSVLIRPLVDIATFAAVMGPLLARRRGRVRGVIATLMVLPLRGLFALIDTTAARLSLRRRV